jgi:hypothetical protein
MKGVQAMVTVKTVKGLADRVAQAEALDAAGAVFPVAGLNGYAVVRNGDGTQMYFVRYETAHERCTCPDFQNRQGAANLPCKHIMAAELALGSNPQPTPPTDAVLVQATAEPDALQTLRRLGIAA